MHLRLLTSGVGSQPRDRPTPGVTSVGSHAQRFRAQPWCTHGALPRDYLFPSRILESGHLYDWLSAVLPPGVGENLKDHLQARITYESRLKVTINDILNNPLRGAWAGLQYYLGRTGQLAQSVASVHAVVRSNADLPHPDLKLQIMLYSGKDRYSRDKAAGLDPFSGFNIGAFQLYPHSTGNLHIRSADPEADPIIHANYLSDVRDQEVLLRGMRMVREISANPALSKLVVREVRPGPETANDDQWLDYIRDTAQTCWHPISTCRMGRGDQDVVDFELQVRGIEGLRVADSSIMPNMPTSNTNSTSIVIGRKGADLLLAANRQN